MREWKRKHGPYPANRSQVELLPFKSVRVVYDLRIVCDRVEDAGLVLGVHCSVSIPTRRFLQNRFAGNRSLISWQEILEALVHCSERVTAIRANFRFLQRRVCCTFAGNDKRQFWRAGETRDPERPQRGNHVRISA